MNSENNISMATETKAAELLGISIKTLQSWRWKGIGPAFVKVGRLVRYRLSALEEFIEKNTTQPRK